MSTRYLCILRGLSLVAASLLCLTLAQAQTVPKEKGQGCVDNIIGEGEAGYQGHRIRSVKVNARYLSLPVPAPGTPYSPVIVSKIVEDVAQALRNERNREDVAGSTELKILNSVSVGKGELEQGSSTGAAASFNAVTSCVKIVDPAACKRAFGDANGNCVDIAIRAVTIRLDSGNVWSNLLPVPRSNEPTVFSQVPGPLLALNPKFGVDYDRKFGAAETFEMSSNLLDLPRTLRSQPLKVSPTRLDLTAQGKKSQNETFYNTNAELSISQALSGFFESIGAQTVFTADHVPLGEGDFLRNAIAAGATVKIQPSIGPFGKITFGARYRRSSNRLSFPNSADSEMTSEDAFEGRILSTGHFGKDLTRLAVWADAASPSKGNKGYNRIAGMFGYQKEVPVAVNQTVGVEAILGAGRARGDVPQYARFYGGNILRSFLYEPEDSPTLNALPSGPLLRSFGSGEATAGASSPTSGGTSYWNLSLNVSIPIRSWSRPLIPDIEIDGIPKRDAAGKLVKDDDGIPIFESRPLKDMLKNQGESSRRVLQGVFAKQGLSPAEAKAKAERELKDVSSLLAFIADQANLYSVKPLIMFDAARIGAPGNVDNRIRYAIGGGLQLTIVVAKFELGYVRTVHGVGGDRAGNFTMRLVFQNLF